MAVLETGTGAGLITKFILLSGFGLLGAAFIAAVDPPKTRKQLFLQAAVAITLSLILGPIAVSAFDYYLDFVNLGQVTFEMYMEVAAPIYAIIGAFSWGLIGFVAKLRDLLASEGARMLKDKLEQR